MIGGGFGGPGFGDRDGQLAEPYSLVVVGVNVQRAATSTRVENGWWRAKLPSASRVPVCAGPAGPGLTPRVPVVSYALKCS